MRAQFIFIPFFAAAPVPASRPAVCGAFITLPTGRFSPVTVPRTRARMRAHSHGLLSHQSVGSSAQPSYPASLCSPLMGPWDSGGRQRGYYGNTIACCPFFLSCSTAGKDHHYKYCSNLFKRKTLERLGDTERMSAAYIDHIKYD